MSMPEWAEIARERLADIWVLASPTEREVIEPIVLQFERDVVDDPFHVGESRDGDLRIEVRLPLVFWFRVSDKGVRVRIVSVNRPTKLR
jgi:hypothetical protein